VTILPAASLVEAVMNRVRPSVQSQRWGEACQVTCHAMSTPVRLLFRTEHPLLAADFQSEAIEWIARFEARYSRFLSDSIVGQINTAAGGDWVEFDAEAEHLFGMCDQMHALSHGIFDPASLPLLRLWTWKATPPAVPAPAAIEAARGLCGWENVHRRPFNIRLPRRGMGIDLGGIGKEYAVDRLVRMALDRGITDVMIDIGQDLRVRGQPPGRESWCIGLEDPDNPGQCWTALHLTEHAVATSGDYVRRFTHEGRHYGHILDPRTGWPVANGCQAATVIAPNCVLAGILSTAAFILGPHEGIDFIQQFGGCVEGCITTRSARHQTRRFANHALF